MRRSELVPPIVSAAARGRLDELNDQLGRRPKAVADVDVIGFTALIAAAERGHLGCVRRLLEAEADPNAAALDGWTALFAAARRGDTDMIDALVEASANVNDAFEEIETSFAAGLPITACSLAAAGGHRRALDRLVAAGAKLSTRDAAHYFKTSLEHAGHRVVHVYGAWMEQGEMSIRSGNDVWHVDRKMNLPVEVTAPILQHLPRATMPTRIVRPKTPKFVEGKLAPKKKREVLHVVEDMTSLTIDWWTFEHSEQFTAGATTSATLPDFGDISSTARIAQRLHEDGHLDERDRKNLFERMIMQGEDGLVAALLETGAVPNAASVALAVQHGHRPIVERLLAAGVPVDAALFALVAPHRANAYALEPLVTALDRRDPRFRVASSWLSANVRDFADAPFEAFTDSSGVVDLGACYDNVRSRYDSAAAERTAATWFAGQAMNVSYDDYESFRDAARDASMKTDRLWSALSTILRVIARPL